MSKQNEKEALIWDDRDVPEMMQEIVREHKSTADKRARQSPEACAPSVGDVAKPKLRSVKMTSSASQ